MKRILLPLIIFALAAFYLLAIIIGQTSSGVVVDPPSSAAADQAAPALNVDYWTLMAAAANVFIAALAVFVIIRTLMTTREMLSEAEKATAAANETVSISRKMLAEAIKTTQAAGQTVNITRDMGLAQMRAYLFFDSVEINVRMGRVEFFIDVHNSGATPVRDCLIEVSRVWGSILGSDGQGAFGNGFAETYPIGDIGAGQSRKTKVKVPFNSDEDERAIRRMSLDHGCAVMIVATARFMDVFGVTMIERAKFAGTVTSRLDPTLLNPVVELPDHTE